MPHDCDSVRAGSNGYAWSFSQSLDLRAIDRLFIYPNAISRFGRVIFLHLCSRHLELQPKMLPRLSTAVLTLMTLVVSVQSQSGIYNNTECMAPDGKISWTVQQPRYYNATVSIQEVGPPVGRILIMLIKNNGAQFTVRCPGDLIRDPYSPKTTIQASCSTDFRGYYFPPKDAVGDVWTGVTFDERDFSLSFAQTWWCQDNATAPLCVFLPAFLCLSLVLVLWKIC